MIFAIWLLLLGILGASNLIISKRPDAEQYIAKIAPYQGWIGAVSALWGVWGIIKAILNIKLLKIAMVWWITWVATSALLVALGLLLGAGVLKTFITQEDAVKRMDETIAKLAPKQGVLGLVAIGLGIWGIIARLF